MLPTKGHFRNIDCPYYETSCDRPYCHFRHRKKANESGEISTASGTPEIPTYNPTPKSQLANVRSHIPISYVPDLAIRTERNSFRSLSSFTGYEGKQPTYNPTPLSILSTGKISNTISENQQPKEIGYNPAISYGEANLKKFCEYVPTSIHEDSNDINFEDLETEFDMIDALISDSVAEDTVNGESESTEDEKYHKKINHNSTEPSKSKVENHSRKSSKSREDDRKHKKLTESDSKSKLDSSSKSSSHSSKKDNVKSESKHRKTDKHSKSNKDEEKRSSKRDEKSKSSRSLVKDKKSGSKEKHSSRHKENSSEKDKHKYSSKSKERDKERKNADKKKPKEKEAVDTKDDNKTRSVENVIKVGVKEVSGEMTKINLNSNDDESCDIFNNFDDDNDSQIYVNDDDDSDLEQDPMEECYKIFTEYKPTEPQLFPEITKQERNVTEDSVTLQGKKRIAHNNADKGKSKIVFNKPKTAPSAAQIMVNRLKAARVSQANNEQNNIINEVNRQALLKRPCETLTNNSKKFQKLSTDNAAKTTKTSVDNKNNVKLGASTTLIDDIISGKPANMKPRRIAPVQNVNSIQRAKAKIEEMAKMRAVNAIVKTATQTLTKGAKRVAHIPEFSVADIPDVLEAEHSKLPVNVRSRYLTMIVDECMKLYISKEEAQQRALNEEYKCYERCSALVTYRNSAMLAINRLRKELQEREMSGLGPIMPGENPNNSKDGVCDLRGRRFYENIKRYILNEEELVLHGFPHEGSMPGHAVVKSQRKPSKGYVEEGNRICCRCSKHYKVDKDGFALYVEECLYHPLKKRTFRGESIYLCCKSGEDTGCVTSVTHVSESVIDIEGEIEGYQMTMPPEYDDDPRSFEVFALDCEMCYTTKGLELTRVTIVNSECKTVYESLVKPLNSIIDYNTRFSGITEEQMNRTATSILQVQANILHLCNSNTILIGHSLESDMKALKIIHSSIIDTSVLFPHKFGLPHKRALRDLAREFLKKIIQNDISGHDSAEDALTCMELVQWKLKEEFKVRGIKV